MSSGRAWTCERCECISGIEPHDPLGPRGPVATLFGQPDHPMLAPEGWTAFITYGGGEPGTGDPVARLGHLCPGCTATFNGVLETGDKVIHNYLP